MKYLKNNFLTIIISFYLILSIFFKLNNPILYLNIINPLFWTSILIYLMLINKNCYIRLIKSKKYFYNMLLISIINIIIYFYLGFLFGFAKSPYSHNILTIFKNIFIQIIPLIGIEVSRSILINKIQNKKRKLVLITLLFIILELNINTFIYFFANKELFFKYLSSTILPLIASNILYTYLALKSSYPLSLILRIIEKLATLLLPILPFLDWFMIGTINLLKITLIYVLFKYKFIKEKQDIRKKRNNLYAKLSYTLTLFLATIYVCFILGIFTYEPIAILSNSMVPAFSRGDVLIYKKLSANELQNISENTIIVYQTNNQNIAHRVIARKRENKEIFYITKGDNNTTPDLNKVSTEQILGIYKLHIKYLGYPAVWLNSYFDKEK